MTRPAHRASKTRPTHTAPEVRDHDVGEPKFENRLLGPTSRTPSSRCVIQRVTGEPDIVSLKSMYDNREHPTNVQSEVAELITQSVQRGGVVVVLAVEG